MTVLRVDQILKKETWPDLKKIDSVEFLDGDVLLVCGGFEERALKVFESVELSANKGLTIVDFIYLPEVEQNQDPLIEKRCREVGCRHIKLKYDRCEPSGIFESLLQVLPQNPNRIFIDISGMSRLLIVQLVMGFISSDIHRAQVKILYTEAESYSPSYEEAQLKLDTSKSDFSEIISFISNGVHDLAILPELSSLNVTQPPILLIAFPSFNTAQLHSAKSIIQPAKVMLFNGIPPSQDLQWRPTLISELNNIEDDHANQISTSTLLYEETLSKLLELYDTRSAFYSFVISPHGEQASGSRRSNFQGIC